MNFDEWWRKNEIGVRIHVPKNCAEDAWSARQSEIDSLTNKIKELEFESNESEKIVLDLDRILNKKSLKIDELVKQRDKLLFKLKMASQNLERLGYEKLSQSFFDTISAIESSDFIAKEDAEFRAMLDHAIPDTESPVKVCPECNGDGAFKVNRTYASGGCPICNGTGKREGK